MDNVDSFWPLLKMPAMSIVNGHADADRCDRYQFFHVSITDGRIDIGSVENTAHAKTFEHHLQKFHIRWLIT